MMARTWTAHVMPGNAPKILVVEDHDDTRLAYARLLGICGFGVDTAADAPQALSAMKSSHIDLVVCDISLRDCTGIELLGRLRSIYPLKAIAVTGHSSPGDCLLAGFDRFLLKPVDVEKLVSTIRALLQERAIQSAPDTSSAHGEGLPASD